MDVEYGSGCGKKRGKDGCTDLEFCYCGNQDRAKIVGQVVCILRP